MGTASWGITAPKRNYITTNTVTCWYQASGFSLPANTSTQTQHHTSEKGLSYDKWDLHTYSNLSYLWTFNGWLTQTSSWGSVKLTPWSAGTWHTGTAHLKITYNDLYQVKTDTYLDGTYQSTSTSSGVNVTRVLYDGDLSNIYAYTQPTAFGSFGVSSGDIIQQTLSASRVNDFGEYIGKWKTWYYQSTTSGVSPGATGGGLVTASIFNKLAKAVGASTVTGGANGTIITAVLWEGLISALYRNFS